MDEGLPELDVVEDSHKDEGRVVNLSEKRQQYQHRPPSHSDKNSSSPKVTEVL